MRMFIRQDANPPWLLDTSRQGPFICIRMSYCMYSERERLKRNKNTSETWDFQNLRLQSKNLLSSSGIEEIWTTEGVNWNKCFLVMMIIWLHDGHRTRECRNTCSWCFQDTMCLLDKERHPLLLDNIKIRGASYDILNTRSRCLQQRMCFLDKGQHPLPPLDNAGVGVGVGVG